jgi:hypothetical protein
MMQYRPTAAELADAVREFLEGEVLPILQDSRLRFRALVAINALGILRRDLEQSEGLLQHEVQLLRPLLGAAPSGTTSEQAYALNSELAQRIRHGEPPPGTLEALRQIADLKLEIASPRYRGRSR